MADIHGPCSGLPAKVCVSSTSVDDSEADSDARGEALTSMGGDDGCTHGWGETVLYGQALACLRVGNTERLSLAQISSTLLSRYNYKVIYNRRVALGITCILCTPRQRELLKQAGAVPSACRRWGTITKREAEHLVKSFIYDCHPPNLPADFVFSVIHSWGRGGLGDFIPALYKYTCARCIKCGYCSELFSPNKFLFHCHRVPGSTYRQLDAAHVNKWRHHIRLAAEHPSERLVHMWEDVQATFNSGPRKPIVRAASASAPQQRPTAVVPFDPYYDATRLLSPASTVMPLPAFALGMPSLPWMDNRRRANPIDVLYTGHFYSPFTQSSDFCLPQFTVLDNTPPRARCESTSARQLGVALDLSLRSAIVAASEQPDDTAAGDVNRRPPLYKS